MESTKDTFVVKYDDPTLVPRTTGWSYRYFCMDGSGRPEWTTRYPYNQYYIDYSRGPVPVMTYPPSGGPVQAVSLVALPNYLEFKRSSNTANWPGTKGARVPGLVLTRDGLEMSRPKKPLYRPPRKRDGPRPYQASVFIPPPMKVRRSMQTEADYRQKTGSLLNRLRAKFNTQEVRREALYKSRLLTYERYLVQYAIRLAEYKSRYESALNKYRWRSEIYERALEASKRPRLKKGVCFSKPQLPQDNPYMKMVLIPSREGPGMSFVQRRTANGFALGFIYPKQPLPPFDGLSDTWWNWLPSYNAKLADGTLLKAMERHIRSSVEKQLLAYDHKLVRKLRSKLKSDVVHVGNLIAERKQTFDTLVNLFKRVLKLVSLKRRVFSSVASYARNPKQIANDILAFKFGVEPLVKDIMGYIEYLDENPDSPLVIRRTNLGTSEKEPFVFDDGVLAFQGFLEMSYVVKCTTTNEVGRTAAQFGMVNPLEIAWEIVPWSFVVDWVIPIGNWIASQTDDLGLKFLTGTRKVKLTGHFELKNSPVVFTTSPDYNSQYDVGIRGAFDGTYVYREVLLELPSYTFNVPLKNPWSWSHGVEAVALSVQRLVSSRR